MRTVCLSLMAAFSFSTLMLATPAAAESVSKDELGGLIRGYLMKNPEVIIEALEAYQEQSKSEGVAKAKKAIAQHKEKIYDAHHPEVGSKNAKTTIVEFFDYNCSACKYMFKPLDQRYANNKDEVRIIFVEYPIFGEQSQKLAKIALVINELAPKKYYGFHSDMMGNKGSVTVAKAYEIAEKHGISKAKIEKELSKSRYSELLEANAALGKLLDVRGTPFLIINGEPVPHALDSDGLNAYITETQ